MAIPEDIDASSLAAAQPSPEPPAVSSDDLDALLQEFESATSQPQSSPDNDPVMSDQELDLRIRDVELNGKEQAFIAHVNSYTTQRQQDQHEADLKTAIAHVRGDLDPEFFDDKFVTAYLDKEARDNPQLQELWLNRQNNPGALQVAINQLAKEFNKTYTRMPDPNVTEDVAAVSAAVRGASVPTPAERPPQYGRMDDRELRDEIKKLGLVPGF